MFSPYLFWIDLLEITAYLLWLGPWFYDTPVNTFCGRQNSKMTPQRPSPCIISSPRLWERPGMMMWYHNITPIIRFCYLAQLTLRKEIMFSGPDLIKWALKKARFWNSGWSQGADGHMLTASKEIGTSTGRIKFCSKHMNLHKVSKL